MCDLKDGSKPSRTSIPSTDSLYMDDAWQERWLSHPDSRIVINPFNYDDAKVQGRPQAEYSNRPTLPLNIGFLDPMVRDARGPEMKDAVMILMKNGDGTLAEAVGYKTAWQPHKLSFSGIYADGTQVRGYDFLYDNRTVVRYITWDGCIPPVLAGEYTGDAAVGATLVKVYRGSFKYVAAIGHKAVKLKFYRSFSDLISDKDGSAEPFSGNGFYAFELPQEMEEKQIFLAISIDTCMTDMEEIVSCAVGASMDADIEARLAGVKEYWDDFLSRLPRPGDFQFRYVDAKGVTPHDIRQMYYAGWVLLWASVVPENTEGAFRYRQLTAGKPSLWGYGDPREVYTAAWDSLYGIQICAFAEPETAWEAFTGIMSMVDRDGMLSGESLPVMRARTAWILYNSLPDKEKLILNFDSIEKNLQWGMEHPYWIWMGNNPLDYNLKDVDFTAAVLVDIPYFIKLCMVLDEYLKADEWQQKYHSYLKEFLAWTFPADGSIPTQTFQEIQQGDSRSVVREKGKPVWVTKSLHVEGLEQQYVERLMTLFRTEYHPGKSMCGFSFVKLEEIAYTIYGLIEKGFREEACTLIEASVRDVVRSRFFGENYTEEDPPVCWGVRPSLFGVVQLIDGVWLRNGYRYDSGALVEHGLYKEAGFVENIHANGTVQNYSHL